MHIEEQWKVLLLSLGHRVHRVPKTLSLIPSFNIYCELLGTYIFSTLPCYKDVKIK